MLKLNSLNAAHLHQSEYDHTAFLNARIQLAQALRKKTQVREILETLLARWDQTEIGPKT